MEILAIALIIVTLINWLTKNYVSNNAVKVLFKSFSFSLLLFYLSRFIQIILTVIVAIKLVLLLF